MHFKTLRSSETGRKFAAIVKKREEDFEAVKAFAEKVGATQWRGGYWTVWGGISSFIFPENFVMDPVFVPNKELKGEYVISRKTKAGKALDNERRELPSIQSHDLNLCVGFMGAPFKTIGFNELNEEYYLFIVGDDWDFKCPPDCEEITVTQYRELGPAPVNPQEN
jgi:hypothetical protein